MPPPFIDVLTNTVVATARYFTAVQNAVTELHVPPSQYSVWAGRTANQNIARITDTAVQFTSNLGTVNYGGMHSTSTNPDRIYAPVSGFYRIAATVRWGADTTGIRSMRIVKSGSSILAYDRRNHTLGVEIDQTLATYVYLAANEYIQIVVYHSASSAGGSTTVNIVATTTYPASCMMSYVAIGIPSPIYQTHSTLPPIVDGTVVDYTYYTQIRDNIQALTGGCFCRSYNNTASGALGNGWTTLTYNTERSITHYEMHSTATDPERMIAPTSGWYGVSSGIEWASATGIRQIRVVAVVSGTTVVRATKSIPVLNTGNANQSIDTIVYLNTDDYIYIQVYQDTGAPLVVNANNGYSYETTLILLGYNLGSTAVYSALPTINVGDIVYASYYNQLRDNLNSIAQGIGAGTYNNSTLTTSNGVFSYVSLNAERYDAVNIHSTASNTERFVIATTGWYTISVGVSWTSNTTGARLLQIVYTPDYTNFYVVAYESVAPVSGGTSDQCISATCYLQAGWVIYTQVYQNSGGALSISGNNGYSQEVAIQLIGHG